MKWETLGGMGKARFWTGRQATLSRAALGWVCGAKCSSIHSSLVGPASPALHQPFHSFAQPSQPANTSQLPCINLAAKDIMKSVWGRQYLF